MYSTRSILGDSTTPKEALVESMKHGDLSCVESARACGRLMNEFGLTYRQVGIRVGRSQGGVANLMDLLKLSEEILESMERGELGISHGRALLKAKDPEVRGELARKAAKRGWASKKGWTAPVLEARAILSNTDPAAALREDVPVQPPDARERGQGLDEISLAAAKAWGDVLGFEVQVGLRRGGVTRLEVSFNSPAAALDAARRLDDVVARGRRVDPEAQPQIDAEARVDP